MEVWIVGSADPVTKRGDDEPRRIRCAARDADRARMMFEVPEAGVDRGVVRLADHLLDRRRSEAVEDRHRLRRRPREIETGDAVRTDGKNMSEFGARDVAVQAEEIGTATNPPARRFTDDRLGVGAGTDRAEVVAVAVV
jgi:hypothetical protein